MEIESIKGQYYLREVDKWLYIPYEYNGKDDNYIFCLDNNGFYDCLSVGCEQCLLREDRREYLKDYEMILKEDKKRINQLKYDLKDGLLWTVERNPTEIVGGQSCCGVRFGTTCLCEELDIKITVGAYKSQIKNKELALKLFDLSLEELVK